MANTPYYTKAESDSKFDKVTAENIEGALGYVPAMDNLDKFGAVMIPEDFDFPYPLQIIRGVSGQSELMNVNKDTFRKKYVNPVIKYVDWKNGSDSNTGADWDNAYKTLTPVYSSNFEIAYFKAGNYATLTNYIFNRDAELISVGGKSNLCYGLLGSLRTWADQTGGVWSNVLTATPKMVCESDLYDSDGDLMRYAKADSLLECQNTVSSFFKDTATNTLYIHTVDGLTPARDNIILSIDYVNISAGWTSYAENINFLHGVFLANNTDTPNYVTHVNCDYSFSSDLNSVHFRGNAICYFERCRAFKSHLDGFNYHSFDLGRDPVVIEIECVGAKNGNTSSGINNGSTAHENTKVLRIGGIYHSNEGPNVHDVNASKSLNIDCLAYNSLSTVAENKSDFAVGAVANESCKIWLDGCITKNDGTFGVEDRTGLGSVFQRNSRLNNVEPGTTVNDY